MILEKNGLKIGILHYCDVDNCHVVWKDMDVGPARLNVDTAVSQIKSLRDEVGGLGVR